MVAVGFFGIGGTLGPAHCEIRKTDGGDIGKIVNGVVEKSDRVADDAADDFGGDEAESGDHGPAEDAGAQGRMFMAVVAMAVTMGMAEMRMGVAVGGGFRGRAGGAIVRVIPVGVIVGMRVHSR
jgi:hypothetical protein